KTQNKVINNCFYVIRFVGGFFAILLLGASIGFITLFTTWGRWYIGFLSMSVFWLIFWTHGIRKIIRVRYAPLAGTEEEIDDDEEDIEPDIDGVPYEGTKLIDEKEKPWLQQAPKHKITCCTRLGWEIKRYPKSIMKGLIRGHGGFLIAGLVLILSAAAIFSGTGCNFCIQH